MQISAVLRRDQPADRIRAYEFKRHVFGAKSSLTCDNYALLKAGDEQAKLFPETKKIHQKKLLYGRFGKVSKNCGER